MSVGIANRRRTLAVDSAGRVNDHVGEVGEAFRESGGSRRGLSDA
jgi:hypothetical protein